VKARDLILERVGSFYWDKLDKLDRLDKLDKLDTRYWMLVKSRIKNQESRIPPYDK